MENPVIKLVREKWELIRAMENLLFLCESLTEEIEEGYKYMDSPFYVKAKETVDRLKGE